MTLPPPTGKIYWDEIVEWDIKINRMKAYTDLKQSKKLADILPIEGADLWWAERYEGAVKENGEYIVNETPFYYRSLVPPSATNYSQDTIKDIPCWSLAALLEQLDDNITNDDGNDLMLEIHKEDGLYYLNYHDRWEWQNDIETDYYDDLVDACVEMIEKLHEQKLL